MENACQECLYYNPFYPSNGAGTCQQRFGFEDQEFAAVKKNDTCDEWTKDDGQ